MPERARLKSRLSDIIPRNAMHICVPIPKHFAETGLLIGSDYSRRFQVNIEVRVNSVIPEIVFFKHGVLEFVAPFLDVLGI